MEIDSAQEDRDYDIEVGECYLEYSEEKLKSGRQLYKHQHETIIADSDVIVLDAPTGAGKTLAALKRVIDRGLPAIFIYPTNSLVRNQVTSMTDLLKEHLDLTVNLISSDSDIASVAEGTKSTDIDLFHLTGDSLATMSESMSTSKGTVFEKLLTGTHIQDRMRILLTNPDTLYLALISKYHQSNRIWEQLSTFQALVLDEFHLYSGPTLARILLMINIHRTSSESPFSELVFLSATHGDLLDLLKNTYKNLNLITTRPLAEEPSSGRKTRHRTMCKLRALKCILSSDEEADQAVDDILTFYDSPITNDINVKVLGIFSSVSFAVRVAQKLRERVTARGLNPDDTVFQLHGMMPHNLRPTLSDMNNAILVGTSAIEVGIDFDVPFLVMEAHDTGSFLQRFGRGGRHQDCHALLSVPRTLADSLIQQSQWKFPEFIDECHHAMIELSSYAGFVCSKQVSSFIYAIALAANKKPFNPYSKGVQFDYDSAVTFFYDIIEANKDVSIGGPTLKDLVFVDDKKRVRSRLYDRKIKTMVTHGFLRGTMNSVVVKLPGELIGQQSDAIGEVNLFDIFKMKGHLESASSHWKKIPSRIRKRISEKDMIFVAENLGTPSYPSIVLAQNASVKRYTSVYQEPQCHLKFKDQHVATLGQGLLTNRNLAFHWRRLNKNTDYRIPRFFIDDEPGGLVIGDWAFVAEYILAKQLEEEENL